MRVIRLMACAALLAGACAPLSPTAGANNAGVPGRAEFGRLKISGGAVYVDQNPAPAGQIIYQGDTVTTGADSSALILLDGGGEVQLDQNTDPVFRFELLREGWCWVANILYGQAYVDSRNHACFEIQTADGSGFQQSVVNVVTGGGTTIWTVAYGHLTLGSSTGPAFGMFASVTVARGGKINAQRTLTLDELADLLSWRRKYFWMVPSLPPELSPLFPSAPPVFLPIPGGRSGGPSPSMPHNPVPRPSTYSP